MKVINSYLAGWKMILQNKKLWILLFAFNFLFALVCTLPFNSFLKNTIGNSLSVKASLESFNYPFVGDFLEKYGDNLSFLLNQSLVVSIAFLLLNIFLIGGVLFVFKKKVLKSKIYVLYRGAANFFWRMTRLSAYFTIVQGLLFAVFFLNIIFTAKNFSIVDLTSDYAVINMIKWTLPVYLFFATVTSMIHDYAKIHLIHTDRKWLFTTIWHSIKIAIRNFPAYFSLYALNIGTLVLFSAAYWSVFSFNSLDSYSIILLSFVVGQLFLFARVGLKLLNLASANDLYLNTYVALENEKRAKIEAAEREIELKKKKEKERKLESTFY